MPHSEAQGPGQLSVIEQSRSVQQVPNPAQVEKIGSTYFERADNADTLCATIAPSQVLNGSGLYNQRSSDRPAFYDLTARDHFAEKHMYIKDVTEKKPNESDRDYLSGRVFDFDINVQGERLGASDGEVEKKIECAVVDRAFMPDIIRMREEVEDALEQGAWHPLEDVVMGKADIVTISEFIPFASVEALDPNRRDTYHRMGSLVVRSELNGTHGEDILARYAEMTPGAEQHEITYRTRFMDAVALTETPGSEDEFNVFADAIEGKIFGNPESRARDVLSLLAAKIINGGDYIDKNRTYRDPATGEKRKIDGNILKSTDKLFHGLLEHKGSSAEPTRTILRAYYEHQKLDDIEAKRPNADKLGHVTRERQKIWFETLQINRYLDEITNAEKAQRDFYDAAQEFNATTPSQEPPLLLRAPVEVDPSRLEFVLYDEIDDKILAALNETMKNNAENSSKNGSTGDGLTTMQRELLIHMAPEARSILPSSNFVIKAMGGTQIQLHGVDPRKEKPLVKDPRTGRPVAVFDTRKSLPYRAACHYPDEAIREIVDPNGSVKSPGAFAVFSAITQQELAANEQDESPVYVAQTMRLTPSKFARVALEAINGGGNLKTQRQLMKKLLDGSTDYASIMAAPHKTELSVVMDVPKNRPFPDRMPNFLLPRRMESSTVTTRDGDTLAITTDDEGMARFVTGSIKSRGPSTRTLNAPRRARKPSSNPASPKWNTPNGELPSERHRQLQLFAVDGSILLSSDHLHNPGDIDEYVSPHSRQVVVPTKKGQFKYAQ